MGMFERIWLIALLVLQSVAPASIAAAQCGARVGLEASCIATAAPESCCGTTEHCCCSAAPLPNDDPRTTDALPVRASELVPTFERQGESFSAAPCPRAVFAPVEPIRGLSVAQTLALLCVWQT